MAGRADLAQNAFGSGRFDLEIPVALVDELAQTLLLVLLWQDVLH